MAFDRRSALGGLTVSFALGASALAATPAITNAWSRPATAGSTGVGFVVLSNSGSTSDALVSVSSPVARKVEMHRSSVVGGLAMMEPAPRVSLPAGGVVRFAPGGHHLMFLGLTRTLKLGDSVPATLTFASGAQVKVRFTVALSAPKDF